MVWGVLLVIGADIECFHQAGGDEDILGYRLEILLNYDLTQTSSTTFNPIRIKQNIKKLQQILCCKSLSKSYLRFLLLKFSLLSLIFDLEIPRIQSGSCSYLKNLYRTYFFYRLQKSIWDFMWTPFFTSMASCQITNVNAIASLPLISSIAEA